MNTYYMNGTIPEFSLDRVRGHEIANIDISKQNIYISLQQQQLDIQLHNNKLVELALETRI